jgi:hypothetical protein
MGRASTKKHNYVTQFSKVSEKISNLLKISGPLNIVDIQKQTQESYFTVSISIGLLYQDKVIEIKHKEDSILISLNNY